jgi:CTP:molybdopterin cytidylyltransferase MocA
VLSAVILAAGDSTRMGSPKAVLRDVTGVPFVNRIVPALGAVTGHATRVGHAVSLPSG